MYTMLTGHPPFWSDNLRDIFKQITTNKLDLSSDRWHALSDEARDLILRLMAPLPGERLDAADALKHQWFTKAIRGDFDHVDLGGALNALKAFHSGSRLKQAVHTFFVKNLLTQTEMQTISEQFKAFDKNGNGKLSREELIEGFRAVRGIDFNEKEIDNLIKQVDLNGSGDIDY